MVDDEKKKNQDHETTDKESQVEIDEELIEYIEKGAKPEKEERKKE